MTAKNRQQTLKTNRSAIPVGYRQDRNRPIEPARQKMVDFSPHSRHEIIPAKTVPGGLGYDQPTVVLAR